MIGRLLVRLFGGWWAQRQRLLNARGPWRRVMHAIYWLNLLEHGSYIAGSATFAGAPVLPHGPTGMFIAPGVRVGSGVTIYQHVHLARNKGGVPTIGDGVLIGAGAIVLGAVTVGDGAKIGAGATVNRDVPAGATAVPAPTRIIP